MRTLMREESKLKESEQKKMLSERRIKGDRLVEKWSRVPGVGKGLQEAYDKFPEKVRGAAFVLENQENHLANLTETQISNAFQTTPENVIRVVRLAYLNSIRGELFMEWGMETARDSIYYLTPNYTATSRGSTSGNVMYESSAYRYASEIQEETIGTGDATTLAFTGTVSGALSVAPLRQFSVTLYVANKPVATDDGSGNLVGATLDTASTNTVNYTTGAITVTFAAGSAPANGADVLAAYNIDTEVSDSYSQINSVELQLKDYQFHVRPWPLYVSWSKMTELLLGTTLNIDAEDALVRGAADELKKSLDFAAIRMAYRASLGNTTVTFDATQAAGEAEIDRAQAFSRAIDNATDVMYASVQRGGTTKMIGGPGAVSYVKLHRRFDGSTLQPRFGAYREGTLDKIDLYKAPSSIIPNDRILSIYRNPEVPEDVSVAFGTLVPLYRTQTLEFKEMYSETGIAFFGDMKVLQPKYLVNIQITNAGL